MTKTAKIQSVQIIPVQGMKAYCEDPSMEGQYFILDIIAIRVTVYENGHTSWYPVNMEQITSESILDSHNIDIYWDWIEFNGNNYGGFPAYLNPRFNQNPFPDNVI